MPIDSVSSAAPWALSCPCSGRALANQARWRSGSLSCGGMHIRPRSLRRGSCATAAASCGQLGRVDAALGELAGDVHLQAHVQGRGVVGSLRRQPLGDLQPIDGVHPGEVLGDRARLVGLQPADEVPGERVVAQRRDLRQRLLQVAFAEILEAQAGRGGQRFRRLGLADRQECDRVALRPQAAAARATRSRTSVMRNGKFCGPINILDV